MTQSAEGELVELMAREQRALRGVLFTGIAALIIVIAISAILGVYYFTVSQKLTARSAELEATADMLENQAFQTRRIVELQADRLARQETEIGRAYEEIRALLPDTGGRNGDAARAADAFLETGALSLATERLIERAAATPRPASETAYLNGVNALIAWDRETNQFGNEPAALGVSRDAAVSAFSSILRDEDFARRGHLGLAAAWFRIAQASGYSRADCERLFDHLAAVGPDTNMPPQALYWMANCERKLGRSADALGHYALALNVSRAAQQAEGQSVPQTRAERILELNAFHGLGTVLIATMDVQGNANVDSARRLAADVCPPLSKEGLSPLGLLAYSCLEEAIRLRADVLDQTRRQVVGSSENLSFIYLKDGQYDTAFEHASEIESETGLFAWNELIRTISAARIGNIDAEAEARRNVSLFATADFNLCEIRVLLDDDLYSEALTIVLTGREAEKPDCNRDI